MSRRKKVRREIYNNDYIGVVVDVADPKRLGRVRVRVEALHGRDTDKEFIQSSDLPWLEPSSRGNIFGINAVGQVVYVAFEDGDYYKGSYFANEHYDINLQNKLDTLSDNDYQNFTAYNFDNKHQYYYQPKIGIMFDYMKSNINLRDNGDIKINLKDNSSNLFLGTEDASQQSLLGNHWMDWMDKFVNVCMTNFSIGNLGAPVMPSPNLLQVCNEYLAIRSTFLSNNVYVVDNGKVKPQTRGFDTVQYNDNYNTESLQVVQTSVSKLPESLPRKESGSNPTDANVPPSNYSENLTTSNVSTSPTQDDLLRTQNPLGGDYSNGKIPIDSMTVSKYLNNSFNSEKDERKYLLDNVAKAIDALIDDYSKQKISTWSDITVTKGYQNYDRQVNTRKQYPTKAPVAGTDPFGFGNQVELYFGVDRSDSDMVQTVKDYIRRGSIDVNAIQYTQVNILDWIIKNGVKYGIKLAGKTSSGDVQWWHFIYDASIIKVEAPKETVKKVDEKPKVVLTDNQKIINDLLKRNVSFLEKMSDYDDSDDSDNVTMIISYATDSQINIRRNDLLIKMTNIKNIPNYATMKSPVVGFESLSQELERYENEYVILKTELDDRTVNRLSGISSNPIV